MISRSKKSKKRQRRSFVSIYQGIGPKRRVKDYLEVSETELSQGWASINRQQFVTFDGDYHEIDGVLYASIDGKYNNRDFVKP